MHALMRVKMSRLSGPVIAESTLKPLFSRVNSLVLLQHYSSDAAVVTKVTMMFFYTHVYHLVFFGSIFVFESFTANVALKRF